MADTITRTKLREWDACYSDERIAALVPEEGLTPLRVLDLDIPAADRLWVVLREDVIPARELRLLACDWAERACRAAGVEDPRSWTGIETARRYARGEATHEELVAARAAAGAARDAAWADAARDAAWAAAAWAAAWAAARDAAGAARAARAAARAAARDAAGDAQIEDVRRVLTALAQSEGEVDGG